MGIRQHSAFLIGSFHRTVMILAGISLLGPVTAFATVAPATTVPILMLEQSLPPRPTLSNILPPPADAGVAGARLGIADNNTTGRFLGQHYQLEYVAAEDEATLFTAAQSWLSQGRGLIIAKLPKASLLKLSDLEGMADGAIIFNVGSADDDLRQSLCRPGLLHTLPSRAMLADALAQFLIAKRWKSWLLLQGEHPEDEAYAQALLRSAKRFGGRIVDRRQWRFSSDLRRSASKEIALQSQAKDYDVALVADESGDIGEFVPYNTWLPRPTAGTQGLTPTAWHWSIEQWGATQLQNRFRASAKRDMSAADFAAWLAVRVVGEAVTRMGTDKHSSVSTPALYRYLLSDAFEISAFMGRGLSFRRWNGQIRQPIALVQPHALVSQSPQEGYLHPSSELDTLGFDRAEVSCAFNPPPAAATGA